MTKNWLTYLAAILVALSAAVPCRAEADLKLAIRLKFAARNWRARASSSHSSSVARANAPFAVVNPFAMCCSVEILPAMW